MKIVKYSHFFTVSHFTSNEELEAMREHCSTLIHREKFKKPNGDIITGEAKKFFIFNDLLKQCHLHINELPNLLERLRVKGVNLNNIEIVKMDNYAPSEINFNINEIYTPRENQVAIIEYFNDPYPASKMCELETGGGKAQWVKEPVLTPDGWVEIGELKVGDKILCPDNSLTYVTGTYPQGVRPLYRVTFEDGRSTLVDKNHLWKVGNYAYHECDTVLDTETIMELLEKKYDVYVPLVSKLIRDNDYAFAQNHVWNALDNWGRYDYDNNEILVDIRYFIHGTETLEKNIRIMGGISHKRVINDMEYLVVRHHNLLDLVTETSTKIAIIRNNKENKWRECLNLKIKSIEYERDDEAVCISISHIDRHYITRDYIVTHNTFMTIKSLSDRNSRALLVIRPQYFDNWTKALLGEGKSCYNRF